MKIEFNRGVPDGCIKWLWENVGPGNVKRSPIESSIRRERQEGDAWFYERYIIRTMTLRPKVVMSLLLL